MTGLEALKIVEKDCEDLEQVPYGEMATIEKELKALEIIKRFIWVEDDKLNCGRFGDIEIELDESDFEDEEEELDLLKEVLE